MKVLLAQTDTTVGFLSQDAQRLVEIKMRPQEKPFLKVYASLRILRNDIRVPNRFKRNVRHARRTTFVVKDQAFRYVTDPYHARVIERYGWLYSTSANESGKSYDSDFCRLASDIVIEDERGLSEKSSSRIYKITSNQIKKLR